MKRNQSLVLVLMLSQLAVASCKKNKSDTAEVDGSVAEQLAKAKAKANGASALAPSLFAEYFDNASSFVLGVNFETLRDSSSYVDNKDKLKGSLPDELGDIETICGFSPLDKLKHLVVAGDRFDSSNGHGKLVVWGQGLKKTDFESCAESVMDKEKQKFAIENNDGFLTYNVADGSFDLAWLDESSFLVSTEAQHREWFKQRIAKKNPLASEKNKMATVERADTTSGIWFAALEGQDASGADKLFGKLPIKDGKGAFGTLSLKDGLNIKGGVMFENASVAENATTSSNKSLQDFSKQTPFLASYVDKLKLENKGNEMLFTYTMSKDELQGIANMAKQRMSPKQ